MSTSVESTSGWDLPLLIENNNYRLSFCSRLLEESPAWFCSNLLAMIVEWPLRSGSLNSFVAVISGGVAIVLNFCNLEF